MKMSHFLCSPVSYNLCSFPIIQPFTTAGPRQVAAINLFFYFQQAMLQDYWKTSSSRAKQMGSDISIYVPSLLVSLWGWLKEICWPNTDYRQSDCWKYAQKGLTESVNCQLSLAKVFLLAFRFVHPRFGPIKCIRTIRAVEKDEELTVAYGYDHNPVGQNGPEAPEWYQLELKAFQAAQQKWSGDSSVQQTQKETWIYALPLYWKLDNQGLFMLLHHNFAFCVKR